MTLLSIAAVLMTCSPLVAGAAAGPPGTGEAPAQSTAGSHGVFAVDDDHHTVVFVPAAGGVPRPVTTGLTDPTKIAPSRKGSIFIVDGTRLLKVNPHRVVTTIRTGMTPRAEIAVDDNNWLFVHDGSSIVKYSPVTGSAPIAVGTGSGLMTVDALGNVSLTAPTAADYGRTMITTFPVRGGKPTVRVLVSDPPGTNIEYGGRVNVIEARDGTLYIEISQLSGGSGATEVFRVAPGSAGSAVVNRASPTFSEYAYTVDASSNFYLLQNRYWCPSASRGEGCVDDYGVDFVQKYDTSGNGRVDTAITGVDLPVGGISVASSGVIYAAVLVSRSATLSNDTAKPQLLRIDSAGGAPVVMANGHFSMPVAEDFFWYAG